MVVAQGVLESQRVLFAAEPRFERRSDVILLPLTVSALRRPSLR